MTTADRQQRSRPLFGCLLAVCSLALSACFIGDEALDDEFGEFDESDESDEEDVDSLESAAAIVAGVSCEKQKGVSNQWHRSNVLWRALPVSLPNGAPGIRVTTVSGTVWEDEPCRRNCLTGTSKMGVYFVDGNTGETLWHAWRGRMGDRRTEILHLFEDVDIILPTTNINAIMTVEWNQPGGNDPIKTCNKAMPAP